MVRDLADWNPALYGAVARWPLREALLAYVERIKASARAQYDQAMLIWAALAPHAKNSRQPDLPPILKDFD
jgi:hypothetical protein